MATHQFVLNCEPLQGDKVEGMWLCPLAPTLCRLAGECCSGSHSISELQSGRMGDNFGLTEVSHLGSN